VVQGLDLPVSADQFGDPLWGGLLGSEAGDRVERLDGGLVRRAAGAAALDLDGLHCVREEESGLDGADLEPADLASAMALFAGAVLQWDLAPGQMPQLSAELLLVALDDQDVVPAPGDDVLGMAGLGVHRVGGDDTSTEIEPFQQRREGRDFIALRGDLPLGDHGLALVQDGGKEVDGRLLAGAAATYGLAVDGHTHQLRGAFVGRVTRVPGQPGAHGVVEGVTVQT
jgi:hypothetical protein